MHSAHPTRPLLLALSLVAGLALSVGGGCVGYSGHPEANPVSDTLSNPNVVSSKDVAATALTWVIKRYPPTGGDGRLTMWREFEEFAPGPDGVVTPRLAVNIGEPGVRDSTYDDIVRRAGPGAVPLTRESESLPIYHIGRVWVEADMATVDVFRPVVPWPEGPASSRVYQAITVRLRGGLKPWSVVAHRVWGIGATPVPELVYYQGHGARQPEPRPEPAPSSTPEKFDEMTPAQAPAHGEPAEPSGP